MTTDHNPQREQMADASMLRTLSAQAEAIWPEEAPLFARYSLPSEPHIADIGCGSGEITKRFLAMYPSAHVVGVDILEEMVERTRAVTASFGDRVRAIAADAFQLPFGDGEFNLVVCRHMTQAVPHPEKLIAELVRISAPGGWLHLLSEDYGMLHFPDGARDPDDLWAKGVRVLARATSTDDRIGRKTWALLKKSGVEDLRVDYATVDTLRVPRATFAGIISAWRDGYAEAIASHSQISSPDVRALFDHAIASILDPECYAVWHVPIVSGRIPKPR